MSHQDSLRLDGSYQADVMAILNLSEKGCVNCLQYLPVHRPSCHCGPSFHEQICDPGVAILCFSGLGSLPNHKPSWTTSGMTLSRHVTDMMVNFGT